MERALVPEDAETVARHRYSEPEAEHRAVYAAWERQAIAQCKYLGWVFEHEGVVVAGAGMVLLGWGPRFDNPNPIAARIANVFTEPERRRRGLARRLVMRCLTEAQAREITHINLGTTEVARALYKSLGFKESKNQMVKYR